ncbi:MAG: Ger(x)C family spore germination protein [Solirubrobacterales bacterium]
MKCKIIIFISLFLSVCTFTGCNDYKYYEKIGFVLTVAAEYENSDLHVTYIMPAIDAQNKSKDEIEIIDIDNGKMLRDARNKSRLTSQKQNEAGKIQQVILSKDLAEKDIGNLLQIFERDIASSNQASLVVVDGSPRDLIHKLYSIPSKPRASFYINQLIKNNVENSHIPETRIYNVGIDKYSEHIDFITPMMKWCNDGLLVTGSALFSSTKMVGEIDTEKTTLLLAMMNELKKGEYITPPLPDEPFIQQPNHGIALKILKCKSKINLDIKDDKPYATINMKMDVSLDEKSINTPMDKEFHKKIEAYLTNELQKDCIEVLNYAKSVNSDPLGIGNLFRAKKNEYFKKYPWKESYSKVKFDVNVSVNLKESGLFK